jgi:3-hydroxymyristoyl/3-hydroxydecanoyl-(acyl carrier protein) dehydratase
LHANNATTTTHAIAFMRANLLRRVYGRWHVGSQPEGAGLMFELVRAVTFTSTKARARAEVSADIPFLADHYPGMPVVPGTLLIELCAQVGGALAEKAVRERHGRDRLAFLSTVRNASFPAPVGLPAQLDIAAELKGVLETSVTADVTATCAGTLVCRAAIVMAMQAPQPGWTAAIETARTRVAAWQARGAVELG